MKSKITNPEITGVGTGISFKTTKNEIQTIGEDNITPIAPIAPINSTENFTTRSIIERPIGPDGKKLILAEDETSWVPVKPDGKFSLDAINNATQNGTNTDAVFERGLESLINENNKNSFGTTGPGILNPDNARGSDDLISPATPGTFTADTKLIGQQLWQYKAILYNHNQEKYEVPTRAIKIICIEDDLMLWPLRGYIIIDNRLEGFERNEDFDSFYFLRSDGRDEIFIDIKPIIEKGEMPDEIWRIKNTYIVYDVEDLPHSDMTSKAKKLYFWDKRFQFLLEKNIQWSTATGKRYISPDPPEPISHTTDNERSMFTGEAIASILDEAGYSEYIDFDNWDWGKGKICFVAKADWTIWKNIQYILQQQISNDNHNDICFFKWNRADNKWNLIPAWKLFEKAGINAPGELQIEHMFFEDTATDETVVSPFKAPLDFKESFVRDIKADEFNKIRNYRFVQPSGLDMSKAILTKPLYSHWHKKKQFDVDVMENEIKYVKNKYFKPNYINYLLTPSKYAVMPLNLTKKQQKSIDPQFSPISSLEAENDRIIRSLNGRGKILFSGIFLNQNLVIRMTGSSHRLSGTFIGIDRAKQNSDTIYDYQICGQYFVTNVKHIIQQQKYLNELTLVKIHAYKDLPVNEGIE